MPTKGMRSIFFSSRMNSSSSSSPSPSPSRSRPPPSRSRPSTPLFSFSESMMEKNINMAEDMINKWNPESSTYASVTSLFYENRSEAMEFLKCVTDLQRTMHFLVSEDSTSEKLVKGHNLMQIAMKRLEKEFYQILSMNRAHLDPESISGRSSLASERSRSSISDYEDDLGSEDDIQIASNSISEVEQVATIAMNDLKSIAECMISSGYGKECVRIYKIIRKSIIDEGLYRLGVEHLSSRRIHKMDWEVLDQKIKNWLNALKVAVKTLFYGERILCDHVFSTSDSIRESCFSEISREGAMYLFQFPEHASKIKNKSSEKIFSMLDLYNAISNLWPEIESIFSFASTSVVRSQALSSLLHLSESVRTMLSDFEWTTQKDSTKSPVQGGGIHPLTRYVTNYLCLLADYSGILSDIIVDSPLPIQSPLPESYFEILKSDDSQMSTISVRFAWLILVLVCKLDVKAEQYKDVSLSYLFLANNLQHVVSNVRRSNLRFIIGEDWISKHEAKARQFATNYERMGWSMVLSALPENPAAVSSPEEVKNCFKKFNSAFETAYRTQSSWVVPDSKLRDEIKVSICNKLVAAYRPFYDEYRAALAEEKNSESLFRFAPDDLGNYLSDLFYGKGISGSSSSSSSSSKHSSNWLRSH